MDPFEQDNHRITQTPERMTFRLQRVHLHFEVLNSGNGHPKQGLVIHR